MFQQQVIIFNMILMVIDTSCIIFAGYSAHYVRSYASYWLWSMDNYSFLSSVIFVMFTNNIVMSNLGLYSDRQINSYSRLSFSILNAVFWNFFALAAMIFVFNNKDYSRAFLLLFAAFTFAYILVARLLAHYYLTRLEKDDFSVRKILVVGSAPRSQFVSDMLEKQVSLGHRVVGNFEIEKEGRQDDRLLEFPEVLKSRQVDEVIFATSKDKNIHLHAYLFICAQMGISARILPALWDRDNFPIRAEQCQDIPFLTMNFNNIDATGQLYKRVLDILVGMVGLVMFLIMYPLVAIAIKSDSEGPVLFRQDRIGQNGRVFKLYKFRSMFKNAPQLKKQLVKDNLMNGPLFKLRDDPRVTRVGRFLRRTSLDELPQVLNVLKGEMSLVGTRPPLLDEIGHYDLKHFKRISIKPGITGLWQISGRNEIVDFESIVQLDCRYLEHWRFRDDIKILLKTVVVVLKRKGAF